MRVNKLCSYMKEEKCTRCVTEVLRRVNKTSTSTVLGIVQVQGTGMIPEPKGSYCVLGGVGTTAYWYTDERQ